MKSLPAFFLGVMLIASTQAAVVAYPEQPLAVVPEPAAALLGALGMVALLRRRRVN